MDKAVNFEELYAGQSWTSRARTVTEADIVNFACQTGDFDPLHVDHVAAKNSPFGRPIAHGLLGLSWVAGLASTYPSVNTLAFLQISGWEFLRPIYVGDTLRVVNEVAELKPQGRKRGVVKWRRKLVNQAGEVVQSGIFETLVARGSASKIPSKAEPVKAPQQPPKRQRQRRPAAN